jgi:hypothetical protein
MEINECLNKLVSYQRNTWAAFSREIAINEILFDIKSQKYKFIIDKLRNFINEGDIEAYKAEKLKLPAVTFCGTFNVERKKSSLKTYNSLIVIDIDKLNIEKLNNHIEILSKDEYVFSYWISPSNNGIKGLVSLEFSVDINSKVDFAHKSAFYKLSDHFFNKYEIQLDSSGNDTTRLCYVSYDENLVVKEHVTNFEITEADLSIVYDEKKYTDGNEKTKKAIKSDAFHNPEGKNKNTNRKEIKELTNYLSKKNISITSEYENRYRIAYAISNTFTYDIGLGYFLKLCKINNPTYNEEKCLKLLSYCYENNTGWTKFNFIENIVIEKGYTK